MEYSEDRRIIKTRKEIINAFNTLLNEKSFSKITIAELAKKANINRGTFYLHYLDKYDLINQCEQEIFTQITNISKNPPFNQTLRDVNALQQVVLKGYPPAFIIHLLEYFQKNSELLKAILGPNGDPSFEKDLKNIFADTFLNNAETFLDISKLTVKPELLVEIVASIYMSVIRYWLSNGVQESPEELAEILFDMASKGPLKASGIVN